MATGIAAIVVAAGAVGCGSSGSDDDQQQQRSTAPASTQETTAAVTPSGPLTRAEFVAAAVAICRETDAKLARLPFPARTGDFPAWATRRAAVASEEIQQLDALTPPRSEQATFTEFKRGLESARDQTVPFWQAVADSDGQMDRVDDRYGIEAGRTARANERLARALGLAACV